MTARRLRLGTVAAALLASGCHSRSAPPPTAEDVEATKRDAAHALAQARTEASKDVKSALKEGGSPAQLAHAKAVAAYDIAMVKAEGDHHIATERCLTLPAAELQQCKIRADADYETAKAGAKVTRVAREQ